ncbi:type IV pili methyl-accepting chemotaxis transducer N-terminal domain-containing protein [Aquabacterium sp. A3]|uniref:type IV pili methyl-accepting chemotaxis transducer N-terminal domain-containing protein n=1 Tax=Aquabacterium sp. A3 TaxID=3132829 RepID=UPI00311991B9
MSLPSSDPLISNADESPSVKEETRLRRPRLTLARKLAAIGSVFLAVALSTVGLSMWITWQLEGGAAAINEAGRIRMMSYQIALQLRDEHVPVPPPVSDQVAQRLSDIDTTLALLTWGDGVRPLTVPTSIEVQSQLARVQQGWRLLRQQIEAQLLSAQPRPLLNVGPFVHEVNELVGLIEQRLEARTSTLHNFQLVMMLLAVISSLLILYAAYIVVLEPVARLRAAVDQVEQGDFSIRVVPGADDELGDLSRAFNRMTDRLAQSYGDLEAKVQEKTRRLQDEQVRLEALYEVSTFVAAADQLGPLTQGFARRMRQVALADAVAIRWSDEANDRYMLLASDSLPQVLAKEEQCVLTGDCFCGARMDAGVMPSVRVIPIVEAMVPESGVAHPVQRLCAQEGYATLVTIPLTLQNRLLGEIELFYRHDAQPVTEDRELYAALSSHLAGAMESLRMTALDRESAVARERKLLSQELHDSIAQSLAFLKIQMGLLRGAVTRGDQAATELAMAELDTGIKESYNDVRELLLHFRVRTDSGKLDLALQETLSKFELQAGVKTHLQVSDDGVPLPADVQIQVLHIVQEALSNVRKHAQAREVWVNMQAQPKWRIQVRDDGRGFDPEGSAPDANHVGLSIMRERATLIGAQLDVRSSEQGTELTLTLNEL